jgi:diaminopimelate dehydrogenase
MRNIRIAVVGYGNVGRATVEAIQLEPDMSLAGLVELPHIVASRQPLAGRDAMILQQTKIVSDIGELDAPDVAILSCPSRSVKETAAAILQRGISTVDGFDIHAEIPQLRRDLDKVAKAHNAVSILAAGWDPGVDSVIRGWFEAMAPRGITYTNFGPGMSMGHSVVARAIRGVRDAISITVPEGMGIHRRMVYVELEPGADAAEVEKNIKQDPYFAKDQTYVYVVENVKALMDVGHGVMIERNGASGITFNQSMRFQLNVNNPALTAQVMVSAARAAVKQDPGCYTMIELPVVDFLHGDVDAFVTKFV